MDQPLFGEQRKETQVVQYVITFIVGAFSIFSVIAGIVNGIKYKEPTHFAMVAVLVVTFANLALLVWWYRDKEDRLHPKFKWLIFTLVVAVLLAGATLNAYAWQKPIVCAPPPQCTSGALFNTDQQSCVSTFNMQDCYQNPQYYCLRFTGGSLYGSCFNYTIVPPPKGIM